eukprot:TRINITY_DN7281_c0_g3_i1.p1 TRINITY_DN7281_c0_g3~~TRINITY_DN7281_c0_g3_i1.p1  ORF type:complete len:123 (-),score=16.70 TRINITY_DN7281_c0_g3_i1:70-438(-)
MHIWNVKTVRNFLFSHQSTQKVQQKRQHKHHHQSDRHIFNYHSHLNFNEPFHSLIRYTFKIISFFFHIASNDRDAPNRPMTRSFGARKETKNPINNISAVKSKERDSQWQSSLQKSLHGHEF